MQIRLIEAKELFHGFEEFEFDFEPQQCYFGDLLRNVSNYAQKPNCILLNGSVQKFGSNPTNDYGLHIVDLIPLMTILDVPSINLMDVSSTSNELPIENSKRSRIKKSCQFLPLDPIAFDKMCSTNKGKNIKNKK